MNRFFACLLVVATLASTVPVTAHAQPNGVAPVDASTDVLSLRAQATRSVFFGRGMLILSAALFQVGAIFALFAAFTSHPGCFELWETEDGCEPPPVNDTAVAGLSATATVLGVSAIALVTAGGIKLHRGKALRRDLRAAGVGTIAPIVDRSTLGARYTFRF